MTQSLLGLIMRQSAPVSVGHNMHYAVT